MKKVFKYLLLSLLLLIVALAITLTVLYRTADMGQPVVDTALFTDAVVTEQNGFRSCGNSYLRHSESGLWELMVRGEAFERGVAIGKLTEDLLYYQEKAFVDQIKVLVPSESYLKFLHFFVVLFNRNLAEYTPEEYRKEIYGISLSATHEYDMIGTPYERQLNYHAAHDIGHTMQDYMLVGCSSFGVWGAESADSSLLVGRNFDFYAGDDFARNKVVAFYQPEQGYRFASVTWAGMTGVLSGMNEAGLTVTINAARSAMPVSAAMPISLLAREILQYASTIDEAYAIACKRNTFVAEALLIGSAKDGKAAIIEKATDKIALLMPVADRIISTNHYQSEVFDRDEKNRENIRTTDSPYRYERLEELLTAHRPLTPADAASVLRDYHGKGGKAIGLCNEKSINQFIAHHSVIFQPEQLLMWVSASPWQVGKYVAYDLKKIFASPDFSSELADTARTIAADAALTDGTLERVLFYRQCTKQIHRSIGKHIPLPDSVLVRYRTDNPEMYRVYALTGDYYREFADLAKALQHWRMALTKEIPRLSEREALEKKINDLIKTQ